MFDYQKLEDHIVQQMEAIFDQWIEEHEDLYIVSLDCARSMESIGVIANTTQYLEEQDDLDSEDYWYYKYCEEEWELFHTFETISADMKQYIEENVGIFSDPETFEYSEAFDEHCEKIIKHCVNALNRFRKSLGQTHSDLILTFHIQEYLDEEDIIEIVEKINPKDTIQEYIEHIEDFA